MALPVGAPDLSAQLTVFVSTVGAPSFDACLEHLRAQDCAFRQEIIDHVAPMSAAFQLMLDRCTTAYYVQVDEDMLLFPHAIRTLYERIRQAESDVATLVLALYDEHLERCIHGIKIFRHAIVRRYPFRDVESCEWDQVRRFERDGFRSSRVDLRGLDRASLLTAGLHGTHWTPRAIFERFATLERKRLRGNKSLEWVKDCLPVLAARLPERRSELDFFALMGLVSGRMASLEGEGREKDYRTYDRLPGFDAARRFYEATQGR